MTRPMPSIPVTWTELLDRYAASPGADWRGFDYCHGRIAGKPAESLLFAVPFQSCVEAIANTLVLGDVVAAAQQIEILAPWVAQIAPERPGKAVLPWAKLAALGLIAMAGMTRTALPADATAAPRMLAATRDFDAPEDLRATIWAHLAFGVTEGLDALLLDDLAAPPETGRAFGPNVRGTQIQIARAIAHRAQLDAVAAAWEGYRDHTPRLIAAGQGSMMELLFALRASCCMLGVQTGAQALDGLRAAVR